MTSHALQHAASPRRGGFTLIEMLVAVTASLMLMSGVVALFGFLNKSVSSGRATIELSGQLRSAALRLQEDLDALTAPTLPWIQPGAARGYFEYIEGLSRDSDNADLAPQNDLAHKVFGNFDLLGDVDDVIMFTARSDDKPFVGRYSLGPNTDPVMIESQLAEIIWWVQNDAQGNAKLYRRVLLIRPDLNSISNLQELPFKANTIADFFNNNDISARPATNISINPPQDFINGRMTANSLEDLSLRQNRFAHHRATFPYLFALSKNATLFSKPIGTVGGLAGFLGGVSQGEDVVLGNLLAFDVKAYDPMAPIVTLTNNTSIGLLPGDPGFTPTGTVVGRGAYVDLNYADGNSTLSLNRGFSGLPHIKSQIPIVFGAFYDTWPFAYEQDGNDQDVNLLGGIPGADQGTNGLDDNPNFFPGADDPTELETSPPYPVPLRGIQITLRVIEPDTRQVRQVTVLGDFIPE